MSPKVQLAVAWVIAAVIAVGAVGVVTFRFMPHKTEALPPVPVPAEDKKRTDPVPSRRQKGSALGLFTYNSADRYDTDGRERCVPSSDGPM